MGLFNRGQGASSLILDEVRAFRAYLGEQLVWDGTMDAFVPAAHIMVSVSMANPVVSATARTVAPFITAAAQVHEPSVSGTATVRPETAILVTGAVNAPDVSADALIDVPAIAVSAIVLAPTVSEAFDATVEAPFIQVTAGMYSPQITVDYVATVPIIAAFAELLAPLVTATGTAVVNAPMIAVTGTLPAPIVRGASAVAAPMIVVSANVYAPELLRDAKVIAPPIAGSGTFYAPNVQGINFTPTGMTKNGNQSVTSASAIKITGWTAESGSTVSGNGLVPGGSKTATATFGLSVTNPAGSQTMYLALYKNGVQVGATASKAIAGFASDTITSSLSVAVTPSDLIEMYAWTQFSATVTVNGGSSTYVRIA